MAAFTTAFLTACSAAASDPAARVPVQALRPAGADVDTGACIDPTLSSAVGFAPSVRRAVADRVAGWVPAKEAAPPDGSSVTVPASPSRPALRLSLHQVSTDADSDAAPRLDVTVPGVAGLPESPSVTDADYATAGPAWQALAEQRAALARAAVTAQAGAARRIRSWPLATRSDSGVRDCLVTAGRSARQGTRLLLASDLLDNASRVEPARDALHGADVIVVQACPAGTETGCDQRLADLASWVSTHGGRLVAHFRSGDLAAALDRWLEVPR